MMHAGSLNSGFLWSRWRGKCSRHSQRMRNPYFTYLVRGPLCLQFESPGHIIILGPSLQPSAATLLASKLVMLSSHFISQWEFYIIKRFVNHNTSKWPTRFHRILWQFRRTDLTGVFFWKNENWVGIIFLSCLWLSIFFLPISLYSVGIDSRLFHITMKAVMINTLRPSDSYM